jgi:lysophospholipase L1-like esterase
MRFERLSACCVVALAFGCGSDGASPQATPTLESANEGPATNAAANPSESEPPAEPQSDTDVAEVTPAPSGGVAGNVEVQPAGIAPPTMPPTMMGVSTAATSPGAGAEVPAPVPAPDDAADAVGPEPDLATRALCTGTDPIACHFGGAPGNYAVTVVLGGDAAATTLVQAETRRAMLPPVTTAAGQKLRFSFNVNVRQPEGQPVQAVPAGTPGLDLYFLGKDGVAPALESIGFAAAVDPFAIYVAGDSTVCDQDGAEFGGWAQQLPQFFDSPVVIANYADSGESSGSFLGNRALFSTIEGQLKANDWVLIQFGHNDKTVTAAQFHDSMTQLVTRVKDKGAVPLLFSPVSRAQFNGTSVSRQHVNSTGANLPQIVAQVAMEQNVAFFDLTAKTTEWLGELGPNGWQAFHARGTDVTHTNDAGALVEAGFVRDFIATAGIQPLADLLR